MMEGRPSLAALASFGPRLDSAYLLGGLEASGVVEEVLGIVYRSGWVDLTFDWTAWSEGRALFLDDHSRIASATSDELRKLITAIARMDRFSEGYLGERMEDGTVQAIVNRAKVLLAGGQ